VDKLELLVTHANDAMVYIPFFEVELTAYMRGVGKGKITPDNLFQFYLDGKIYALSI